MWLTRANDGRVLDRTSLYPSLTNIHEDSADIWSVTADFQLTCIYVPYVDVLPITPIRWQSAVSFLYQKNRRASESVALQHDNWTVCLVRLARIRSVQTSLLCSERFCNEHSYALQTLLAAAPSCGEEAWLCEFTACSTVSGTGRARSLLLLLLLLTLRYFSVGHVVYLQQRFIATGPTAVAFTSSQRLTHCG